MEANQVRYWKPGDNARIIVVEISAIHSFNLRNKLFCFSGCHSIHNSDSIIKSDSYFCWKHMRSYTHTCGKLKYDVVHNDYYRKGGNEQQPGCSCPRLRCLSGWHYEGPAVPIISLIDLLSVVLYSLWPCVCFVLLLSNDCLFIFFPILKIFF